MCSKQLGHSLLSPDDNVFRGKNLSASLLSENLMEDEKKNRKMFSKNVPVYVVMGQYMTHICNFIINNNGILKFLSSKGYTSKYTP